MSYELRILLSSRGTGESVESEEILHFVQDDMIESNDLLISGLFKPEGA